jgi:8-oxo-dGTP pyrophosphatase MutT (NUDIX family)
MDVDEILLILEEAINHFSADCIYAKKLERGTTVMERHFTNSVYVYNPVTKEFLFIKHKKLKKWLQPGGHWEVNELPDDSATREVLEETGLQVTLVGERLPRESDQVRPYGIQRNVIVDGEHEHLDLIYLAVPIGDDKLIQNVEETDDVCWFTVDEINSPSFNTFDAQQQWVKFFYDLMTKAD